MLIKCHECQREISDQAANCPGCGNQLKPAIVNDPKLDRFLTRNRGCLEVMFWAAFAIFLISIIIAVI